MARSRRGVTAGRVVISLIGAALAGVVVLRAARETAQAAPAYYLLLRQRVADRIAAGEPSGGDSLPGAPAVIAHRGGAHLRPENTVAAFAHAVELGADVLELDVWLSRDGVPMVIHDETVDRTTNGSGAVADLTLAQLTALDAAYHWPHHGDQRPWRGRSITIPTLEELLLRFPDELMLIEIKSRDPAAVDAVGALIRRYGRQDRTMVGSFERSVLRRFRERYPSIATSASQREVIGFLIYHWLYLDRLHRARFNGFQVPESSGRWPIVTGRFLRNARRKNLPVEVWTVNDLEDMRRLARIGVDGLITDRPDLALTVRRETQ